MKRPASVDALFAGRDLPKSQRALGEMREYIKGLERIANTPQGQNASLMWKHVADVWDTLSVCRACELGNSVCPVCEHYYVKTRCPDCGHRTDTEECGCKR